MQAERRIKTVASQTGPGVPVITELFSLHLTVVLWSAVVLADIWQAVVCFPLLSSPRLSEPWRWLTAGLVVTEEREGVVARCEVVERWGEVVRCW